MFATGQMDKGWLSRKLEMIKLLLSGSLLCSGQAELLPFVDEMVISLLINLAAKERCILVSVPAEHVRNIRKALEQIVALVFGFTTTTVVMDASFTDLTSALFIKTDFQNTTFPMTNIPETTPPGTPPTGNALPYFYRTSRRTWRSDLNQQQQQLHAGSAVPLESTELNGIEDHDRANSSRNMSLSALPILNDSTLSKHRSRISNSNLRVLGASRDTSNGNGLSSMPSQVSMSSLMAHSGSHSARRLPNAVILEGLQNVNAAVQAALLELLVTQQVSRSTTVCNLPDTFIIIAVVPISNKQLNIIPQLLDRILLRHSHEGPLPKLAPQSLVMKAIVSPEELHELRLRARSVFVHPDVSMYMRDLITALRNHKVVQTGVTPLACRHLRVASSTVAAVLGYSIITPAHVSVLGLCLPKFLRRIELGASYDLFQFSYKLKHQEKYGIRKEWLYSSVRAPLCKPMLRLIPEMESRTKI
ncbi:hypothetical protein SeMB42_g05171 [Synchytrium endobioticum]|uniref:Magnesium chelatase n=1 Tax=Synchytrium endobioticum TaxID=286115 RepID=A0A507CT51_9FUNG|nr:hypothetical protein SeLEV6574_g07563 [Synchytrium endobioticum]TPX42333.1 hypothetical protein SeMB42_g05171 [Synchytrium endobioticum]